MNYFSDLGVNFIYGCLLGIVGSIGFFFLVSIFKNLLFRQVSNSNDKSPKFKLFGAFSKKQEFLVHAESLVNTLKNDLLQKEKDVNKKLNELQTIEIRLKKQEAKLIYKLEKTSDISQKDAKSMLLEMLMSEVTAENQKKLQSIEDDYSLHANQRAIDILITAMQRFVSEQVTFHSSSMVHLPNDEIKGRIIGKEGRNIKTLEMATGMEFVIGDTPEVITISGFNPVRREIAKRALNLLIMDGRINPTRIEEAVEECAKNINKEIEDLGKQTIVEFGLKNVHPDLMILLGQLNFRSSYTQNVLNHSKEVAILSRMIAYELGLDVELMTRCGLFHDIGKAISSEVEGSHSSVGAKIAKQYGEHPIVINAIASHHYETPAESVYAPIVAIADTISAARPGARREALSTYIQRMENLEEIARQFVGVKKSFAFQAGREIRVIVDEFSVSDVQASVLAKNIAKKIESEMVNIPGQIKINVIRESRVVEYTR